MMKNANLVAGLFLALSCLIPSSLAQRSDSFNTLFNFGKDEVVFAEAPRESPPIPDNYDVIDLIQDIENVVGVEDPATSNNNIFQLMGDDDGSMDSVDDGLPDGDTYEDIISKSVADILASRMDGNTDDSPFDNIIYNEGPYLDEDNRNEPSNTDIDTSNGGPSGRRGRRRNRIGRGKVSEESTNPEPGSRQGRSRRRKGNNKERPSRTERTGRLDRQQEKVEVQRNGEEVERSFRRRYSGPNVIDVLGTAVDIGNGLSEVAVDVGTKVISNIDFNKLNEVALDVGTGITTGVKNAIDNIDFEKLDEMAKEMSTGIKNGFQNVMENIDFKKINEAVRGVGNEISSGVKNLMSNINLQQLDETALRTASFFFEFTKRGIPLELIEELLTTRVGGAPATIRAILELNPAEIKPLMADMRENYAKVVTKVKGEMDLLLDTLLRKAKRENETENETENDLDNVLDALENVLEPVKENENMNENENALENEMENVVNDILENVLGTVNDNGNADENGNALENESENILEALIENENVNENENALDNELENELEALIENENVVANENAVDNESENVLEALIENENVVANENGVENEKVVANENAVENESEKELVGAMENVMEAVVKENESDNVVETRNDNVNENVVDTENTEENKNGIFGKLFKRNTNKESESQTDQSSP